MITLDQVGKQFTSRRGTHHALSDVSLTIDEGSFVCLLGPSGCGKSTLLNLIAGLDHADSGRIALGSEGELETCIELACRLRFIERPAWERISSQTAEVGRLQHPDDA